MLLWSYPILVLDRGIITCGIFHSLETTTLRANFCNSPFNSFLVKIAETIVKHVFIYRSSKSNEPTRCRVQSENAKRQFLRELEGSGGNKNAAGTLPRGTAAHMAMLESMSSLAQKQSNIVIEMFLSSVSVHQDETGFCHCISQQTAKRCC